jgi:hypothetical protein
MQGHFLGFKYFTFEADPVIGAIASFEHLKITITILKICLDKDLLKFGLK